MRCRKCILLALSLMGCSRFGSQPSDPPAFPAPDNVHGAQLVGLHAERGSLTPEEARRLTDFVRGLPGQWTFDMDTYPIPGPRVLLQSASAETICLVDVFAWAVGSDCGLDPHPWPPLLRISPDDGRRLRAFVQPDPSPRLAPTLSRAVGDD